MSGIRNWAVASVVAMTVILPTLGLAQGNPGAAWDRRYDRQMYVYGKQPVDFLRQMLPQLQRGRALVLAAGEGRNAVFLAQQGFAVTAVDASVKGLEKCQALAAEHGVSVHTVVADLDTFALGEGRWDLITNFYYHDPGLYDRVMEGLKPGGFFILQNFSLMQLATNRFGPKNAAWLVAPNQLTRAFNGWHIRHYEDTVVELDEGMHKGPGAVVRLLVEKIPVD
jgi:SAM-dependent methyltransferase